MRYVVVLTTVAFAAVLIGCGSTHQTIAAPTSSPNGAAMNSAQFVYTSNVAGFSISGFRINADGSLTPTPGSPVNTTPGGNYNFQVAVAQAGKYLLSQDQSPDTLTGIQVFSINPNSGALTPVGTQQPENFHAGGNMAVDQDRAVVYTFGTWQHNGTAGPAMAAFKINHDGSLSPLATPVPDLPGLDGTLALDPNGRFLYVEGGREIAAIALNVDGSLGSSGTPVNIPGPIVTYDGSSVPPMCYGQGTGSISVAPSGNFLYMTCGGVSALNVFSIQPNGELKSVQTVPLPIAGSNFTALALNPKGTLVAAAETPADQVVVYTVDADSGKLHEKTIAQVGTGPSSVAWDKSGTHMYVGNGWAQLYKGPYDQSSDNVSGFSVAPDGSLTPTPRSPYSAGQAPIQLIVAHQ